LRGQHAQHSQDDRDGAPAAWTAPVPCDVKYG
jgi:hypothetical protein